MKRNWTSYLAGVLTGAVLFGGTVAGAAGITATQSQQPIYIDGQRASMTAYSILGNNYVKLRDIGQAMNFNVSWDGVNQCVQVESNQPYEDEGAVRRIVETEPAAKEFDLETEKDEIILRTNQLRRENGLPDLQRDDLLMQAAQVRAEEMAAATVYSHVRPDGSQYYTVTDDPYMMENIHRIQQLYLTQQKKRLGEAAAESWANSEGHRKNMLNPRGEKLGVGLAVGVNAYGQSCYYCVQMISYAGYTATWVDGPVTG